MINIGRIKNDRCAHCGASAAIHHFSDGGSLDEACPVGGHEEMRTGIRQGWRTDQKFEDSGLAVFRSMGPSIAQAMDSLAVQLLIRLKFDSNRVESVCVAPHGDMLALSEARKLMEMSGIAPQCDSYRDILEFMKRAPNVA